MKGLGTWMVGCLLGSWLLLAGCGGTGITTPQAFGTLNRLVVIADQDIWDGHVGDTLRFYLGAAYPVLPQPEPLFDLKHFTAQEFRADIYRKRFRNMLFIADASVGNSPTLDVLEKEIGGEALAAAKEKPGKANVKISPNRWANRQQIMFLYGHGEQAVADVIKSKCAAMADVIRENDKDMLNAQTYMMGRHPVIMDRIKEKYGISLPVPGEYEVADDNGDFMWIRHVPKNTESNTNFLLYKQTYRDTSQLTPLGAKSLHDSIGRFITSNVDGSHMRVDDVNLPLYSELQPLDGRFALQQRGIWEMSHPRDMMAGPFMSYTIHNAETDEIIFIDAFAFAPGDRKRDIMQEMELVMSKIEFVE